MRTNICCRSWSLRGHVSQSLNHTTASHTKSTFYIQFLPLCLLIGILPIVLSVLQKRKRVSSSLLITWRVCGETRQMTPSTSKFLLELPPISQTETLNGLKIILLSQYSFLNTTAHHFLYHQIPALKKKKTWKIYRPYTLLDFIPMHFHAPLLPHHTKARYLALSHLQKPHQLISSIKLVRLLDLCSFWSLMIYTYGFSSWEVQVRLSWKGENKSQLSSSLLLNLKGCDHRRCLPKY